jgi:hypothetical protein
MAGCIGVQRFQVSESPNFNVGGGITVSIANVPSNLSGADISVTYPNGVPGGRGIPYSVPTQTRTINALAVLFAYEDANGNIAGTGSYETPTWFNRVIFGDGIIGYDGYFKKNSYKDHLYQSTAGHVILTGKTYPKVIRIPLEKFRTFLDGPVPTRQSEIFAAINIDDPTFLQTNSFEYYFFSGSDEYALNRGVYESSSDHVVYSLPVDSATSILANTIQEVRTSHDAARVVTRYNVRTVEGVWLATDTARTGTNYFTGGSQTWNVGIDYSYITLGTPLPSPNTSVLVRYRADIGDVVDSSVNDRLSGGYWLNTDFHENYHIISRVHDYGLSDSRVGIGDPYRSPIRVPSLDALALGNTFPFYHPLGGSWNPSPLLNGATKYWLGFVVPYTLRHGENEDAKRLAQAEFSDVAAVRNNTTSIKIPLHKFGDPGLATKIRGNYDDAITSASTIQQSSAQDSGDEYVLLEIRNKQLLADEQYNFDEGVLSEGIIAYHVVDGASFGSMAAHWSSSDILETIDATPPFLGGFDNTSSSPAAFGPASNVYQLTIPELWQDKDIASAVHAFDFLLSEGRGAKTVYARFVDAAGNVLGTQTLTLTLDSDQTAAGRVPTISSLVDGLGNAPTTRRITFNYSAPNTLREVIYCWDNTPCKDAGSVTTNASGSIQYNYPTSKISDGAAHTLTIRLYDLANIRVDRTISYLNGVSGG